MAKLDLGKIILTVGDWAPEGWVEQLRAHVREEDLIFSDGKTVPPKSVCQDVTYAVAWHTPPGFFGHFPNLKALLSTGAGVDHLVARDDVPKQAAIIRVVDPDLTGRVTAWAVMNVIMHHRQAMPYLDAQKERDWRLLPQAPASDVRVGLMGYGELGQSAERVLTQLGYQCAAWARSPKPNAAVQVFHGEDQLVGFLGRTDILVALLPLTPETTGILNMKTFKLLARDGVTSGPYLINGGRGRHQDETDLLEALQDGTLRGASIDVFHEEPLPKDNPLWSAPNLILTPHSAGMSAPDALCSGIVRNLIAFSKGEPVDSLVDRSAGY